MYGAYIVLTSFSGRRPTITVPVRLVVPAYQVGINAGGAGYLDGAGDTWMPDVAYTEGGFGFRADRRRADSTRTLIEGTEDQALYQNLRQAAYEYRFDAVPDGVYAVELGFAEVRRTRPNARLFDVIIEGQLLIPALDVANDVGSSTALSRTFYVPVSDGQLNVRLISRKGDTIINAIRVTERPDRVS